MPKGVYDHKQKRKTSKKVMDFVKFTFRPDIAEELDKVRNGRRTNKVYGLAIMLYYRETGILINPSTAYGQKNKWVLVDGEIRRKT